MDNRPLELDEFIVSYPLRGEWEVSYTDSTHLPKDSYVKLGDIKIDSFSQAMQDSPVRPFSFRPVTSQQVKSRYSEIKNLCDKAEQASRLIRNQLADSMVRTGLLRPTFCLMEGQKIEMDFTQVMKVLSDHNYLIVVVDTSALRRAAISFLHKALSKVLIWTVVPVFVMNEVQQQVNRLNKIWRDTAGGTKPNAKNFNICRNRPQVSCISQELNYIRQWRPVEMLTTLPEHLGQSNGDSKVDRLIIESVKNLKRDRGLHYGVYLLTGDKDMASLATIEDLNSLHFGVPSIAKDNDYSSVRYDSFSKQLILTSVHCLLWDLALVFGKVRLTSKGSSPSYELDYYASARGGFFARDVIGIREW